MICYVQTVVAVAWIFADLQDSFTWLPTLSGRTLLEEGIAMIVTLFVDMFLEDAHRGETEVDRHLSV